MICDLTVCRFFLPEYQSSCFFWGVRWDVPSHPRQPFSHRPLAGLACRATESGHRRKACLRPTQSSGKRYFKIRLGIDLGFSAPVGRCLIGAVPSNQLRLRSGTAEIRGNELHRAVFAELLKGDQEFVADAQAFRIATSFVQFVVCRVQNHHHFLKNRLGRPDTTLEYFLRKS